MFNLNTICAFLIFGSVLGLLLTKKTKNIKTFLIVERQYSIAVIVAIITATLISGGLIIGSTEKIFQEGLIYYLSLFGIIISIFIISEFIAPQISTFYDCISVGDIMQKAYGKEAKISIGIASFIQCIMMFGVQISAFGHILSYFYNLDYKVSIILGSFIIVMYAIYGGIKLITITDVIQFGILMVAIPMICNTGLLQVGGYISLIQSLPEKFLYIDVSEHELTKYIGLFLTFLIPVCGPYTIQRLLMTQNTAQAVRALRYSAIIILIYYFLIMLIAVSLAILEPDLEPIITLPFLIDNFLPHLVQIIAIVGLIIIIITSANAILNTAAISLVHDIAQGFQKNQLKAKTEIVLATLSSGLIALCAIIFTTNFSNIIDMVLYANEFWSPIVFVPLVAGIYKIKFDKISFFISIFMGLFTVIIWKHWNLEHLFSINGTLPGVIVNLIFMTLMYNIKLTQKLYNGRGREI